MSSIRQIQAKYDAEEDRLLLRVGTELDDVHGIWLTRRYLRLVLKALAQYADADPDVGVHESKSDRQDIKDWKARQALDKANFDTPFEADRDRVSSGLVNVPLAYKLNYRITKNQLQLTLLPKQGEGLNVALNQEVAASMTAILQAAAAKAEWRINQPLDPVAQQNLKIIN